MAVGYIGSGTGSQGFARNATGNLNVTLTAAPSAAGQWVFVAWMAPSSFLTVNSATCGTITLNNVDGNPSFSGGTAIPLIYAAPYQAGMSTTVAVSVTNNSATTAYTAYACAVVISGCASYNSAYANFRTSVANGLFDGASANNAVGGITSNGSTSLTSGVITFTNTSIATSYDAQDQPFIMATWQNATMTAPQLISGATTIDSSGNVTTSGQATGTVVLASAASYGTTGTGYLDTPNGCTPISWTGKSGNNLTGCTIPTPSIFAPYATSLNQWGIILTHPMLIGTSSKTAAQTSYGWQSGIVNAQWQYGVNIATAAATGGLAAGNLTLSFGQSTGLSKTPAYCVVPSATVAGSVVYTLVPSTRTMSRTARTTEVLTDKASKAIGRAKTATGSAISSALASKTLTKARKAIGTAIGTPKASKTTGRAKTATATHVRAAKASRTVALLKTAKATLVNVARESKRAYYYIVSAALAVLADYDTKTVTRAKTAIATHVRAARASRTVSVLRTATATLTRTPRALKAATFNRTAKATAVNSVTVTRRLTRNKTVYAVAVYSTSTSKTRTYARRAIATAVAVAKASPVIRRFVTHPGTVSAAVMLPNVRGSITTATVSSDLKAPSVRATTETASVTADTKAGYVQSKVKPLV